ncbi:NADH:ubiquinone oxidoreductase subunit NDUFA12 [Amaricoccus solimangrovi]|uniref:NADH:ubiquinone oxidoreductase subunit NDUFA12 n=1 Tax=Amaricoccus solimangrovi TaxID=2589815 RepID=A0A501WQG6_9RHOB|nr:NADH:ubiquinone oxidoreductase subunit NDUFA12 [Amaricoccus solimangrovi]TPE49231.1 NADH:ubiquinone oxidoreductase subunit NDUFA12 [Amaricoccus solimangrovi]
MKWLLQALTWWNGETLATRFFTWRNGKKVGADADGNVYYQNADGTRRWVIFNGEVEASRIAPEWHGWLHHTWQQPPTEAPLATKPWVKPHRANATGGPAAYHPTGSLLAAGPGVARDYEAWTPE